MMPRTARSQDAALQLRHHQARVCEAVIQALPLTAEARTQERNRGAGAV